MDKLSVARYESVSDLYNMRARVVTERHVTANRAKATADFLICGPIQDLKFPFSNKLRFWRIIFLIWIMYTFTFLTSLSRNKFTVADLTKLIK